MIVGMCRDVREEKTRKRWVIVERREKNTKQNWYEREREREEDKYR